MYRILLPLREFAQVVVGLAILAAGFGCAGSASRSAVPLETVRQAFPSVTDTVELPLDHDAEVPDGPGKPVVSEVRGPSGLLGYLVETKVTGRSGPFGIAILLDEQCTVRQATVVSYPWTHGRDVGRRSFTRQFEGKGPGDTIEIGRDIDAMTGATLSCRAMARGVRAAVKLLAART